MKGTGMLVEKIELIYLPLDVFQATFCPDRCSPPTQYDGVFLFLHLQRYTRPRQLKNIGVRAIVVQAVGKRSGHSPVIFSNWMRNLTLPCFADPILAFDERQRQGLKKPLRTRLP